MISDYKNRRKCDRVWVCTRTRRLALIESRLKRPMGLELSVEAESGGEEGE